MRHFGAMPPAPTKAAPGQSIIYGDASPPIRQPVPSGVDPGQLTRPDLAAAIGGNPGEWARHHEQQRREQERVAAAAQKAAEASAKAAADAAEKAAKEASYTDILAKGQQPAQLDQGTNRYYARTNPATGQPAPRAFSTGDRPAPGQPGATVEIKRDDTGGMTVDRSKAPKPMASTDPGDYSVRLGDTRIDPVRGLFHPDPAVVTESAKALRKRKADEVAAQRQDASLALQAPEFDGLTPDAVKTARAAEVRTPEQDAIVTAAAKRDALHQQVRDLTAESHRIDRMAPDAWNAEVKAVHAKDAETAFKEHQATTATRMDAEFQDLIAQGNALEQRRARWQENQQRGVPEGGFEAHAREGADIEDTDKALAALEADIRKRFDAASKWEKDTRDTIEWEKARRAEMDKFAKPGGVLPATATPGDSAALPTSPNTPLQRPSGSGTAPGTSPASLTAAHGIVFPRGGSASINDAAADKAPAAPQVLVSDIGPEDFKPTALGRGVVRTAGTDRPAYKFPDTYLGRLPEALASPKFAGADIFIEREVDRKAVHTIIDSSTGKARLIGADEAAKILRANKQALDPRKVRVLGTQQADAAEALARSINDSIERDIAEYQAIRAPYAGDLTPEQMQAESDTAAKMATEKHAPQREKLMADLQSLRELALDGAVPVNRYMAAWRAAGLDPRPTPDINTVVDAAGPRTAQDAGVQAKRMLALREYVDNYRGTAFFDEKEAAKLWEMQGQKMTREAMRAEGWWKNFGREAQNTLQSQWAGLIRRRVAWNVMTGDNAEAADLEKAAMEYDQAVAKRGSIGSSDPFGPGLSSESDWVAFTRNAIMQTLPSAVEMYVLGGIGRVAGRAIGTGGRLFQGLGVAGVGTEVAAAQGVNAATAIAAVRAGLAAEATAGTAAAAGSMTSRVIAAAGQRMADWGMRAGIASASYNGNTTEYLAHEYQKFSPEDFVSNPEKVQRATMVAMIAGVPAAALDMLDGVEFSVAKRLLGQGAREVRQGLAKAAAAAIGKLGLSMAREGATGAGQSMIGIMASRYLDGKPLDSALNSEEMHRFADDALGEMFGGGAMHVGGSAIAKVQGAFRTWKAGRAADDAAKMADSVMGRSPESWAEALGVNQADIEAGLAVIGPVPDNLAPVLASLQAEFEAASKAGDTGKAASIRSLMTAIHTARRTAAEKHAQTAAEIGASLASASPAVQALAKVQTGTNPADMTDAEIAALGMERSGDKVKPIAGAPALVGTTTDGRTIITDAGKALVDAEAPAIGALITPEAEARKPVAPAVAAPATPAATTGTAVPSGKTVREQRDALDAEFSAKWGLAPLPGDPRHAEYTAALAEHRAALAAIGKTPAPSAPATPAAVPAPVAPKAAAKDQGADETAKVMALAGEEAAKAQGLTDIMAGPRVSHPAIPGLLAARMDDMLGGRVQMMFEGRAAAESFMAGLPAGLSYGINDAGGVSVVNVKDAAGGTAQTMQALGLSSVSDGASSTTSPPAPAETGPAPIAPAGKPATPKEWAVSVKGQVDPVIVTAPTKEAAEDAVRRKGRKVTGSKPVPAPEMDSKQDKGGAQTAPKTEQPVEPKPVKAGAEKDKKQDAAAHFRAAVQQLGTMSDTERRILAAFFEAGGKALPAFDRVFSQIRWTKAKLDSAGMVLNKGVDDESLTISLPDLARHMAKAEDAAQWGLAALVEEAIHVVQIRLQKAGRIKTAEAARLLKAASPEAYKAAVEAYGEPGANEAIEVMRMVTQKRLRITAGGITVAGVATEETYKIESVKALTRFGRAMSEIFAELRRVLASLFSDAPAVLRDALNSYVDSVETELRAMMANQETESPAPDDRGRSGADAGVATPAGGSSPAADSSLPQIDTNPPAVNTVDAPAHDAATSPENDTPEPTDAQKKAGNYKMGHVTVGGMQAHRADDQGYWVLVDKDGVLTPIRVSDALDETGNPIIDETAIKSGALPEPVFYSQLERTVEEKMPERASAAQLRGIVENTGNRVKAEELKWTGLLPWAEAQPQPLTKAAVLDFLRGEGAVRFEEVTSPPNYAKYQLPGGENYREVVLAMPHQAGPASDAAAKNKFGINDEVWNVFTDAQRAAYRQDAEERGSNGRNYKSSHFTDVPNYVAHMRLNERPDAAGNPGLFIEEIQSDRHQEGRKKGYVGEMSQWEKDVRASANKELPPDPANRWTINMLVDSGVPVEMASRLFDTPSPYGGEIPDAPFRTTWPLQMFKRALRDAVAAGKRWIGWTSGATQVDRFDLSKEIDRVMLTGDGRLVAYALRTGDTVINQTVKPEELPDIIGKEAAEKLLAQPAGLNGERVLSNAELKVGGKGMVAFYDKILPTEVHKYVKQWGGKVVRGSVNGSNFPYMVVKNPDGEGWVLEKQGWEYESDRYHSGSWDDREQAQKFADKRSNATPVWRVNITPEMEAGVSSGQPVFSSAIPEEDDIDAEITAMLDAVDGRGGVPRLALSMMSPADKAVDMAYVKDMSPQSIAEWNKEADAIEQAHGKDGAFKMLARKGARNEMLTPAETILMKRYVVATGRNLKTAADRERAFAIRFAYRNTGGEVARAMRARVDEFMTPAERLHAYLTGMLFEPSDAAKTAATKKRKQAEEAEPKRAEELRKEAEKIETEDVRRMVAKLEADLKKSGLTIDEWLNTDVRIEPDAPAFVRLMAQLDKWKQTALRRMQGGDVPFRKIAKELKKTEAEVAAVRTEFEKRFREWAMSQITPGMTADQLIGLMGNAAVKSGAIPEGMSDADKEKLIQEALRKMGLVAPAHQGKAKAVTRRNGKRAPLDPDTVAKLTLARWKNPAGRERTAVGDAVRAYTKANDASEEARDAFREKLIGIGVSTDLAVEMSETAHERLMAARLGEKEKFVTFIDTEDAESTVIAAKALSAHRGDALDMAREYWYFSTLSGPKTQLVNAASYPAHMVLDKALTRGAAALFNSIFSMVGLGNEMGPKLGELGIMWKAVAVNLAGTVQPDGSISGKSGWADAWRLAVMSYRTGMDFLAFDKVHDRIAHSKKDVDDMMDALRKMGMEIPAAAIPGITGKIIRAPMTGMQFIDVFGKTVIAHMEAAAWALRIARREMKGTVFPSKAARNAALEGRITALLNEPGSRAWKEAIYEATEAGFQTPLDGGREPRNAVDAIERSIAGVIAKIDSALQRKGQGKVGFAGDLLRVAVKLMVMPFTKTPYNIMRIGLRKSPIGAAAFVARTAQAGIMHMMGKAGFSEIYGKFFEHLAEQTLAWGAMALLFGLAEGGGDDDKDSVISGGPLPGRGDRAENMARSARYGGDYVLRIGDRETGVKIPYGRYDPVATVLGTTIDMIRAIKMNPDVGGMERANRVMAGLAGQMSQKTFLRGLSDLVAVASDVSGGRGDRARQYGYNLLATIVPNVLKAPVRDSDDYMREWRTASAWYQFMPVPGNAQVKVSPGTGESVKKEGAVVARWFVPTASDTSTPLPPFMRAVVNYNAGRSGLPFDKGGSWAPDMPDMKLEGHPALQKGAVIELKPEVYTWAIKQAAGIAARSIALSPQEISSPTRETVERIRDEWSKAQRQVRDTLRAKPPEKIGTVQ